MEAEEAIRQNPLSAVAIAVGLGFLFRRFYLSLERKLLGGVAAAVAAVQIADRRSDPRRMAIPSQPIARRPSSISPSHHAPRLAGNAEPLRRQRRKFAGAFEASEFGGSLAHDMHRRACGALGSR
jgi:hypothetical protein